MAKRRDIENICDRMRGFISDAEAHAPDGSDMAGILGSISDCVDDIETEADELQSQISELEDEANEYEDAPEPVMATTADEIQYTASNFHYEQIMEALDSALQQGRTLHLLDYLYQYKAEAP